MGAAFSYTGANAGARHIFPGRLRAHSERFKALSVRFMMGDETRIHHQ